MKFSISDIARITGGRLCGASEGRSVEVLEIDSRSPLARPDATMFCALSGARDGHRYVAAMYSRGVRSFLVSRQPEGLTPDAAVVVVPDVDRAVAQIAAAWRDVTQAVYVGITGSVGKTVMKELAYRMLAGEYKVSRSPRSWNSRLGVPLSVSRVNADAQIALIEVGIDSAGAMAGLAEIVRPSIGILTPITDEHSAGFPSLREKVREKLLLFAEAELLIYPADTPYASEMFADVCPKATPVAVEGDYCSGALAALAARFGLESPVDAVEWPSNRIGVTEGVNDCVVMLDKFTPDIESLAGSLDFMSRRMTPQRRNTVILGDLFHPAGTPASAVYATAAAMLAAAGVDRVIGVGAEVSSQSLAFAGFRFEQVKSAAEFVDTYTADWFSGESILVFGHGLEQVAAIPASPRHDTTLEVNLDSLIHNYNHYRSLVSHDTGIVAMVKASAYGLGSVEIAKTLQSHGAAYLAVAVIDEGVELRRGGITMPIMVLNPITGNYKALFDNDLEPAVFSLAELDTLCEASRRSGVDTFKAHIKLDTGMHRVGFTSDEIPALIDRLRNESTMRVASIFTHLAAADCPDLDSYTDEQFAAFDEMSERLLEALPYRPLRHVHNTAGIMRYGDRLYDMVRLGIGLYGVSPLEEPSGLKPVASLRSTIISLHEREAGTPIGYGCRDILQRRSLIATVPVGYADGLDRRLSRGRGQCAVCGVECPIVGNVCMDLCMVDVTDAPGVSVGDTVEFFGTAIAVERLAEQLETIPYEILTSVAPRVKRVYYRD